MMFTALLFSNFECGITPDDVLLACTLADELPKRNAEAPAEPKEPARGLRLRRRKR